MTFPLSFTSIQLFSPTYKYEDVMRQLIITNFFLSVFSINFFPANKCEDMVGVEIQSKGEEIDRIYFI